MHPSFPLHLWCRLLPLATATLNLLRPSRINPKLSAYELLHGTFDYNKTPLAPPGSKVLVHDAPAKRGTWDSHGTEGWYIGAAPDHYRCHTVYIPSTKSERIAKAVKFFPHKTPVLHNSILEEAISAARKLANVLSSPASQALFRDKNDTAEALTKLADLFLARLTTLSQQPARVPNCTTKPVTTVPTVAAQHPVTTETPRAARARAR